MGPAIADDGSRAIALDWLARDLQDRFAARPTILRTIRELQQDADPGAAFAAAEPAPGVYELGLEVHAAVTGAAPWVRKILEDAPVSLSEFLGLLWRAADEPSA